RRGVVGVADRCLVGDGGAGDHGAGDGGDSGHRAGLLLARLADHPRPVAVSAGVAAIARLRSSGCALAVGGSLTGGLLGAELLAVPGASAVFRGGALTYATDSKARVLGVDAGLLAAHGPVHPQVAVQMADGARSLF